MKDDFKNLLVKIGDIDEIWLASNPKIKLGDAMEKIFIIIIGNEINKEAMASFSANLEYFFQRRLNFVFSDIDNSSVILKSFKQKVKIYTK